MSIILTNNTLTINGSTKFYIVTGSANDLIATSDSTGNIVYGSSVVSNGDENYPADSSIFSGSDSYITTILKNRTYFVKSHYDYMPNSEVLLAHENDLQTNNIGDKFRIFDLTQGGNPVGITGLSYRVATTDFVSGKWIVFTNPALPGALVNEEYYTDGSNFTSSGIERNVLSEFTLLWSPLGMCKNGVRLTINYPSTGFPLHTYTSTDYVWYRTKRIPSSMHRYIDTGLPPAPFDPGTGGGGGGGGGGVGF